MLIEPSAGNPVEEGFGNAIVFEPLNFKKFGKNPEAKLCGNY